MTISTAENLLSWLRDAHAIEEQAERLFSGQSTRLKDYPELSRLLLAEVNISQDNQRLLSIRIQQLLGGGSSVLKDAAGKLMAMGQNFIGTLMADEQVKGVLSLYTLTHLGIGSYTILIKAADAAGDIETKNLCKTILLQYKSRTMWLERYLQEITAWFLEKSAA